MTDYKIHWQRAISSLHTSTSSSSSNKAQQHFQQAIQNTPTPNTLIHAIHRSNFNLLNNQKATRKSSPHIPPPPPSASQPLRLFVYEAALLNAYNTALLTLRPSKSARSPAKHLLQSTIANIHQHLLHIPCLLISFFQCPPSASNNQNKRNATSTDICLNISDLAHTFLSQHQPFLSSHQHTIKTRTYACRWSRATTHLLDLYCAINLLIHSNDVATAASSAASAMSAISDALETSLSSSQRHAPESITAQSIVDTDACRMRTSYLKSVSLAASGDIEAAKSVIIPIASLQVCPTTTATTTIPNPMSNRIIYATALFLILSGNRSDALKYAELSVANTYRLHDALALAARAAPSVHRWRIALGAVKNAVERPASLWLACRALGRRGLHDEQLALLKLAEDADACRHTHVAQSGCVDIIHERRVTVSKLHIMSERARVLYGLGRVKEALELSDEMSMSASPCTWTVEESLGRAKANMALNGDSSLNVRPKTWWEHVGLGLAQTEVALRHGMTKNAMDHMGTTMRRCIRSRDGRGSCNGSMSYISTSVRTAEEMLRACVLYNFGVVHVCMGDAPVADDWFAAAQTVLQKCAGLKPQQHELDDMNQLVEEVRSLATRVALGRCVTLFSCGRREDAAAHWVEKRGLHASAQFADENENEESDMDIDNCKDHTSQRYNELASNVDDRTVSEVDRVFLRLHRKFSVEIK